MGDFYLYLHKNSFNNIDYQGLDILPEMIAGAQTKYPNQKFTIADFMADTFQEKFDFLITSGSMNILTDHNSDHLNYIKKFIAKMYQLSNLGCAFNLLNKHGQYLFAKDERFYYADPDEIFTFCQKICPQTKINSSYLPHDFTIYMRKTRQVKKNNRENR